jgi:sugar-specific transcriptional regulator TrmB
VSDVIAGLRHDLEQRLKEIERELAEHEPLLRERDQIQVALEQPPFADGSRTRSAPAAKRAPATRKPAAKRAPRGANREAILTLVGERPGVSASEISSVTKIARAVTYNTLAKLVEQGQLEKSELPGGQTGYKAATPSEADSGL